MARGRSSRLTLTITGEPSLRKRVTKLERRIAMLTAVLRLVLALLRISGFKLPPGQVHR